MKRMFFAAPLAVSLATFVYASAEPTAAAVPAQSVSAREPEPTGAALARNLAHTLATPSIPDGDEPYVGADAGLGFTWDIPDTWFQGGIYTFPLDFAPDVPGSGNEVVEQTPNFFTATDPEYFSYTFAWWLNGDPNVTAAQLSSDFTTYYDELMGGCTYGQYANPQPCNVANYRAHFVELFDLDPGPRAVKSFLGEAQLYDFFVTGNLITIHMIANTYDCPRDGHRVILYSASPAPFTAPVWKELLERQAAFRCE